MQVFADIKKLQAHLSTLRQQGHSIGFAPTMGALHAGHLSLLAEAQKHSQITVCSIFVNPTQFNQVSDLEKYPRVLREDLTLLEQIDCDIVFVPEVKGIYPEGLDTEVRIDLDGLDQEMEGAFRPGHFDGMLQVVHRLLTIVQPDSIYMGQKDYQQYALVRHMCKILLPDVQVVCCPIIREVSGLAMSSRNRRISPQWKQKATILYLSLKEAAQILSHTPPTQIQSAALKRIGDVGLRPDYFDLVDGVTLRPIEDPALHPSVVACTAAWAGDVRLIDNMILKSSDSPL